MRRAVLLAAAAGARMRRGCSRRTAPLSRPEPVANSGPGTASPDPADGILLHPLHIIVVFRHGFLLTEARPGFPKYRFALKGAVRAVAAATSGLHPASSAVWAAAWAAGRAAIWCCRPLAERAENGSHLATMPSRSPLIPPPLFAPLFCAAAEQTAQPAQTAERAKGAGGPIRRRRVQRVLPGAACPVNRAGS